LISECLYLRKEVLLLPIEGQYEQMVNAHYVQKLGLGLFPKQLDADALAQFLPLTDHPMPTRPDILCPDNRRFFELLNQTICNTPSAFDRHTVQRPTATPKLALG